MSYRAIRRAPRFDVEDWVGTLRVALDARLLSLGLIGAVARTRLPLEIGATFAIELGDGEPVRIGGRVAWCRPRWGAPGEGDPVAPDASDYASDYAFDYDVGLEFHAAADTAEALLRLVPESSVGAGGRAPDGRLRLPDRVRLSQTSGRVFLAKRMSLGGMLIETKEELAPEIQVELRFPLSRDRQLSTRARVVYVAPVSSYPSSPRFEMGIEFVGLSAGQYEALETLILEDLAPE